MMGQCWHPEGGIAPEEMYVWKHLNVHYVFVGKRLIFKRIIFIDIFSSRREKKLWLNSYRSEDKTVLLEVFGAGSSIENLKSLKANTTDAAVEKHLPVVTQEGNKITVAVSSVEHPMLPEHYIMGVYIETKNGGQLHKFVPG